MEGISYKKIFFTVLLSVFIANLSAGAVFKYWIEYEAKIALEQASLALERTAAELERNLALQQEKRKSQLKQRKRYQERETNAQRINREVCQTWSDAYSKERNSYNEMMRDNACKRAKRNYFLPR